MALTLAHCACHECTRGVGMWAGLLSPVLQGCCCCDVPRMRLLQLLPSARVPHHLADWTQCVHGWNPLILLESILGGCIELSSLCMLLCARAE